MYVSEICAEGIFVTFPPVTKKYKRTSHITIGFYNFLEFINILTAFDTSFAT